MSPVCFDDRTVDLKAGQTIFDSADKLQVRVPTSCKRSGECHECVVEIRRGMEALSEPGPPEGFLRGNYRLACQSEVIDPAARIEFSLLKRQPKILTSSPQRPITHVPLTRRQGDSVYFGDRRVGRYRGRILGLAIDLGTTTVVFNLVDLENGQVLATSSFENPQRFGGSDIMHRISYDGGKFQGELHRSIITALNFEIGDLCRRMDLPRRMIYEVVLVGNSAMRDIFFNLDVQSIGQKPYISLTEEEMRQGKRATTTLNVLARELGLRVFPRANVYGGPLIGCHVGADIAADLLTIAMDRQEEVVMLVDVGTNTEVVVGNRHRMMAASCPAGPAFEGGLITYGMPGYSGAIESVRLRDSRVEWQTIEDAPPRGICGSGLIDLVAELRRSRRMTELGVFVDGSQEFEFEAENGMTLSRLDISNLAQAKAANFCGQRIVMHRYGIRPEQVDKLYLAGGFANYINIESAIEIGFIPDLPLEKIIKVGNASLQGATIMLLSQSLRSWMEKTSRQIEHVELETTPDFFDLFVEGCMFRSMDHST